jgi:small subunit ribosomal protein S16
VAVKIKLMRLGKIRQPYYRIVVADARTRRNGKAIETIGKYHPKAEPSFIEVDSERAQYWLGVGALPTEPVQRILEITGDWQKFKGLPGAEGKLKVAAAKPSKQELFNIALAEAGSEPLSEATTPKRKAGGRKADEGDAKADKADAKSAGKADAKADTKPKAKKSEDKAADGKPAEDAPTEAKSAEAVPAEAKSAAGDAPAEAKAADAKAADGKPAEATSAEAAPAEGTPAEESGESEQA